MSIKIFYNTEEERLNIIIENQGKDNIENKEDKYFEYCEEDEIIIDGEIVKNENYLNELKEEKIKELKEYNKNVIYSKYSQSIQFDILAGIGEYGSLEDMKIYINSCISKHNRVKDLINSKKTIKTVKEIDIEEEYNKNVK